VLLSAHSPFSNSRILKHVASFLVSPSIGDRRTSVSSLSGRTFTVHPRIFAGDLSRAMGRFRFRSIPFRCLYGRPSSWVPLFFLGALIPICSHLPCQISINLGLFLNPCRAPSWGLACMNLAFFDKDYSFRIYCLLISRFSSLSRLFSSF
jgi:hypothetical protein